MCTSHVQDGAINCPKNQEGKRDHSNRKGKIFVVSTGPGSTLHLTQSAIEALRASSIIVGYKTYINLIKDLISDKRIISSKMGEEVKRCREVIDLACAGEKVSLVSGGDAGIYGMAGLILEIMANRFDNSSEMTPDLVIIPGIPAFVAASSLLGAPIMHDFSSISLSDHLTPWEIIEKRLTHASLGDFVIIIYNPKSQLRPWQFDRAIEIIKNYKSPTTPVGVVKNAMRENQEIILCSLEKINSIEIDMNSIIIIGNSKSYIKNNFFITPRGYDSKYNLT